VTLSYRRFCWLRELPGYRLEDFSIVQQEICSQSSYDEVKIYRGWDKDNNIFSFQAADNDNNRKSLTYYILDGKFVSDFKIDSKHVTASHTYLYQNRYPIPDQNEEWMSFYFLHKFNAEVYTIKPRPSEKNSLNQSCQEEIQNYLAKIIEPERQEFIQDPVSKSTTAFIEEEGSKMLVTYLFEELDQAEIIIQSTWTGNSYDDWTEFTCESI
jgi:hypothetical protein